MALTDLTRVSTSGIATGTTLDNAILRKDISFKGDQVGINSALFDSSERRLDFKDNVKLRFGDSGDLSLSHNINDSVISHSAAATGALKILSGGAQSIECIKAGAVNISHNGSTKIETTSTGTVVTGVLTATSFSGPIVGHTHNTSGISTFYNLRVSNDLTVEGTTTTLDTNLVGVDRVEVGANSNTVVGVAITQSGTADILQLFDGTSQVVTVDDQGNVGINESSPEHMFHIKGTSANNDPVLAVESSSWATGRSAALRLSYTDGDAREIRGHYDHGLQFILNNGEAMRIITDGKVVIGGNYANSANFGRQVLIDGTLGLNNDSGTVGVGFHRGYANTYGYIGTGNFAVDGGDNDDFGIASGTTGDILFGTGSGAPERLRITSAGSVGIGTSIPGYELHVWPPAATSSGQICAQSNGNNTFAELVLKTDGGSANIWRNSSAKPDYGGVNSLNIYNSAAANIAFFTNASSAAKLIITSTGLIGIGDISPTVSLSLKRNQTSNHYLRVENTNTNSNYIGLSLKTPTLDCQIWNQGPGGGGYGGANSMNFYQAGTYGPFAFYHGTDERLRIDTTGALGLGAIPKNNTGNYRQLQIGLGAHFYGRTDDTPIYISSNAYRDGSDWKYTANTTVSHIALGSHINFKTAASGTAGTTATLVQRVRITNDGKLCVGTTSAPGQVGLYLGDGTNPAGHIYANGTHHMYLLANAYHDGAWKYLGNGEAQSLSIADGEFSFHTASNNGNGAGQAVSWETRLTVSSNQNVYIWGGQTGNNRAILYNGSGYFGIYGSSDGSTNRELRFHTGGGAASERMRITTGGQVLISNASPPTSGALFVNDEGSGTPITSGTTARIANNGSSGSYAIVEIESGNASWDIRNSGAITHKFAGRHGHLIGSTDGSGAYITLDGEAGGTLASGSDYMYMEHTSSGMFEMWNGKTGVTVSKFMDVHPQGYMNLPKKPLWNGDGFNAGATAVATNIVPIRATRSNINQGGHFDNTPAVFTCPCAGKYDIRTTINQRASYNLWIGIYIMVNGAAYSNSWWPPITGDGGSFTASHFTYMPMSMQIALSLAANDEIAVCYHTSYSAPSNTHDVCTHIELIA